MNEIKKLYNNAGIKPKYIDACTVEDKYWNNEELANEFGTFDMYMNAKCGQQENCSTLCSCAYTKEKYPPFTAEKQIELIKWLAINKEDFGIFYKDYDEECCWVCGCMFNVEDYLMFNEDAVFEESLAGLINNLWQNKMLGLTVEEKEQIKEILKG